MIEILHSRISEYIKERHIPGAAVIVRRGGEVIHLEYAGYADIANGIPVTESTLFRLASMTKPIIAVGIMMLAEKGLLTIKDEIAEYIPEFADMKVAARMPAPDAPDLREQVAAMDYEPLMRPIIIEDLLRHRSGLGHGPVSMLSGVMRTEPGMTLAERMKAIAACPMDFQPGKGAGYSAVTAFDILGRIIELVTGRELQQALSELIFEPLGMRDATFYPDAAMLARIPRLYARPEKELIDTAPPGEFSNPLGFSFPCGSAGLYATLRDYDRFTRMLANGGELDGTRLLRADTVSAMAAPCPNDLPLSPGSAWGLGMCIFQPYALSKRYLAKGTFGWSGAYGTHFYIDPVNGISMTLMVNRADINGASSYVSHATEEMIFKGLQLKSE